jgi:hypothetical protein
LNEEWIWAALLCTIPFVAFGGLELIGLYRRRRVAATARRSKTRPGGRP